MPTFVRCVVLSFDGSDLGATLILCQRIGCGCHERVSSAVINSLCYRLILDAAESGSLSTRGERVDARVVVMCDDIPMYWP